MACRLSIYGNAVVRCKQAGGLTFFLHPAAHSEDPVIREVVYSIQLPLSYEFLIKYVYRKFGGLGIYG